MAWGSILWDRNTTHSSCNKYGNDRTEKKHLVRLQRIVNQGIFLVSSPSHSSAGSNSESEHFSLSFGREVFFFKYKP